MHRYWYEKYIKHVAITFHVDTRITTSGFVTRVLIRLSTQSFQVSFLLCLSCTVVYKLAQLYHNVYRYKLGQENITLTDVNTTLYNNFIKHSHGPCKVKERSRDRKLLLLYYNHNHYYYNHNNLHILLSHCHCILYVNARVTGTVRLADTCLN